MAGLPPAPHLGPTPDDRGLRRDRFEAAELASVLSHYDLGVIRRVRPFPRGSRRSPKLRIASDRGMFLLKRHAPGRDDPRRVTFAHDLQRGLDDKGFPVARLIATRISGSAMIELNGRVYELFEFVTGRRDDGSVAAALEAGHVMGRLHELLQDHETPGWLRAASYHAAPGLRAALRLIPSRIQAVEPDVPMTEIERRCAFLEDAYRQATRRAAPGLATPPPRIIHGDWHPGNLLYREGRIVAVLDFDSARVEPRVMDVANGALQFGMTMREGEAPDQWPVPMQVERMRAFVAGYNRTVSAPLTEPEMIAFPWLIEEALILESVMPIAATGRFAQLSGHAFLTMVDRKVRWLRHRADKLVAYLADERDRSDGRDLRDRQEGDVWKQPDRPEQR